jgi:hypothetical protein
MYACFQGSWVWIDDGMLAFVCWASGLPLACCFVLVLCVHPHASLSWPPSQRRRCIFQQKSLVASGLVRLVMSKWRTARYVRVPVAPLPPSWPRFCVANMAFMQFCLNCISVIFLLRAWHVARRVARNGREQFRCLAHIVATYFTAHRSNFTG